MSAFDRLAGAVAYAVAAGSIAYSAAFVIAVRAPSDAALALSWTLLMGGGLLTVAVLVAIYLRVRHGDPGVALLGMLLAAVGLVGSAIHGGYELAIELHPVERVDAALPHPVDPRGLLTFGLTGAGVLLLSRAIRTTSAFEPRVAGLGTALGVLLILVYLGRLIILDPDNPALLGVAGVTGVIVHPLVRLGGRGAAATGHRLSRRLNLGAATCR